jgi:Flp pilus assembly protein TadD
MLPREPALRNNFAQISLLLKAEPSHARAVAQDLYKAHPHNAAFASTYAFALFQSGDVKGPLKIMRQLTPEQLQDPSVAAYFGILLAAAGQNDNATEYFALAEKARLLPEEEELVAQTKASLAGQ